jgi:FMN reductase (NADPH)
MNSRKTSFQQRFGKNTNVPTVQGNELIERQLSRLTIRKFIPKPLEDGLLELLVASASCSATSGALQSYSVLALTTPEEKEKLFSTPQSMLSIGGTDSNNVDAIRNCSVFLIWIADLSRIDFLLKNQTTDTELLAQTSKAEYHLKAVIDATIAAQAFAMLAESMGLGVMYCGAVRQIKAEHFEKEFGFPKLTFPIFGMAVGYPDNTERKSIRPRIATDVILHKGNYKPLTSVEEFEEQDKLHKGSPNGRNLGRFTYIERIIERMKVSWTKKEVSNSLKHMGFKFD